ncbi:MAG: DUF998 domain-containing protein [Halobacteriales archaeon]|nr:DUF998 domain-containing protein [Halobacteriales archaeon]
MQPLAPRWPLLAAGAVAVPLSLGFLLLAVGAQPGFSWERNNLSDLALGPAYALFTASLLIAAAGGFAVAAGLRGAWRPGRGVMTLANLSLLGVAAFTEREADVHRAFAGAFFGLAPLALMLLGVAWLRTGARALAWTSLAIGMLALVGIVALGGAAKQAGNGLAIPEMLQAVLLGGWTLAVLALLRRSRSASTS